MKSKLRMCFGLFLFFTMGCIDKSSEKVGRGLAYVDTLNISLSDTVDYLIKDGEVYELKGDTLNSIGYFSAFYTSKHNRTNINPWVTYYFSDGLASIEFNGVEYYMANGRILDGKLESQTLEKDITLFLDKTNYPWGQEFLSYREVLGVDDTNYTFLQYSLINLEIEDEMLEQDFDKKMLEAHKAIKSKGNIMYILASGELRYTSLEDYKKLGDEDAHIGFQLVMKQFVIAHEKE